ncbi:MAG: hypothetical protein JW913_10100 [Chitinispirillaceae bacterium]|nr:hypothetical protein [Chitinispirillaceae bacterium]
MNVVLRIFAAVAVSVVLPRESFSASVSFDLSNTGGVLQPRYLAGTCLPIWNNANVYSRIQKGLAQSNYRLFRFPNGTLSNGYHWNGTGAYTADSVWVCDSQSYSPGFMSMTIRRGTSVSNWGFNSCSNITDGDTATWWRSDDLISESLPYCYLALSKASVVDSVVILWGERYAVDFDIDFFTKTDCPYPGPFGYPDDLWENQQTITDNDRPLSSITVSGGESTQYVRILVKKFKDTEKSVEVKEVYLFSQDIQVSNNVKAFNGGGPDNQTSVIAMPTFIGNTARPGTAGWKSWDFEAFMAYVQSFPDSSVPVICVNYGTGTPEEAAAWVFYANIVKKYNIRFWEIGNEPDGAWEDGGPVTARMYAEKFLLFSKAMKKIDPSIKVFGPLLSNAWFDAENSGLYDGKSWMKAFIDIVGREEKADGRNYCDGIDFHSYPYWDLSVDAKGMLETVDYVYEQIDSLRQWIDSSLAAPESVFVMMSEFNSMTILSDLLQKPINGIYVANMYAGLAEKFGSRAMSVFWDSFEEGNVGNDNTFGSFSLFNTPGYTYRSSLDMAPSAAYWALFAAQNIWIDPKKENSVVHADVDSSHGIRAYGIRTADDFRALIFNFSLAPETVSCVTSENGFGVVDVFTWGDSQFTWIGSDKYAFAFPNCGPSSKTYSKDDLSDLVVPGLSLCILRYRDSTAADQPPRFMHLLSTRNTGATLVLPLCGSVSGGNSVITGIDYSFDGATTFSRAVRSLDAGFDGPFESFSDSLSVEELSSGSHILYLQARNASGMAAIDSISFSISDLSVESPCRRNSVNGWNVTEKKSRGRIRLFVDSPLPAGRRIPITARVISLNGTCISVLSGKGNGRTVIEWSGKTAANRKAAPGVYFITVSAGGKTVYRTTAVIGKQVSR